MCVVCLCFVQLQLAHGEVKKHRDGAQAIRDTEEKWSAELTQSTCELHMCQDKVRVLEEELRKCQEELDLVRGDLNGTQRILQMTSNEVHVHEVPVLGVRGEHLSGLVAHIR